MKHVAQDTVEGDGATAALSAWASGLDAASVPAAVHERAKYLILDGVGCALVGAHVPWSAQLAEAVGLYEPEGHCSVIGYTEKYGPLAAAILNGAFIQATELDDYHSQAPLHSVSVVLPALMAAVESEKHSPKATGTTLSGLDLLVAAVVGFETGPRAGNAIYGTQLLTRGWHSGPVFGCPAAAAAAARLLRLSASDTESAIGIACTQAGGLMAAQYEGMIKRVQHAFAARNGLFGALLARTGYVGIKKVFERPYGGFLAMFAQGNGQTPPWRIAEVTKGLGEDWHTSSIRVKLYACVAGTHGQIEVLQRLQAAHPARFARENLGRITSIRVGLSEAIYAHDGWAPDVRPLSATGAQMCAAYVGAVQLVDREALLRQFAEHTLDRDEVWALVRKTACYHDPEFDQPEWFCGARVEVRFEDGETVVDMVPMPRGYSPGITNEQILDKFRRLAHSVMAEERVAEVEEMILGLDRLADATELPRLLAQVVKSGLD